MDKPFRPLFIGLYDAKLLGIRYLSSTLKAHGYDPQLIFLKNFNSHKAEEPTAAEYELLINKVLELNPAYIGISIMCSFYLPVAKHIALELKKRANNLIILGGVYPTLFPKECLEFADVVFMGEAEGAIVDFTRAFEAGLPYDDIDNLAIKLQGGEKLVNPVRPYLQDLDTLPHPDFGGGNIYYINNDKLTNTDPEAHSFSYEMTTSRGCPNHCSFCSNANLRKIYAGKGKSIRQRGVDDVFAEIAEVKKINKGLQLIRFWDEIFPWDLKWVEEFAIRYKREVKIPFEIWGNPLLSAGPHIKMLKDAGLSKIVIGIQSGCPKIRKDVYLREETQEEIIKCSQVLADAKVPIVIYDFILGHPFESTEDLRNTLELCRCLKKPFRLQLHGLSFLPGTKIEEIAVERGVKTWEEIRAEQSKPLKEQYHENHWWRRGHNDEQDAEKTFWYTLIFLTQFMAGGLIIKHALKKEKNKNNPSFLVFIRSIFNYWLLFKVGMRKLIFMIKNKARRFVR